MMIGLNLFQRWSLVSDTVSNHVHQIVLFEQKRCIEVEPCNICSMIYIPIDFNQMDNS